MLYGYFFFIVIHQTSPATCIILGTILGTEVIMPGEKLLSESACKSAKPKDKVYYLNDGKGLEHFRIFKMAVKEAVMSYFQRHYPCWLTINHILTAP